jgi:hypothetical protein
MQKLIESVSAEATAAAIALVAFVAFTLREAFKKLSGRAVRLAELRFDAEIARLEAEKVQIATAAGVRIANAAAKPDTGIRGAGKKALAVEQAADLLGADPDAIELELANKVQAVVEEEKRRSIEPDALTPAETPTAKLRRIDR